MGPGIVGLRGTGEWGIQGVAGLTNQDVDDRLAVRPRNYRELFTLLEPNGNAPLNALLAMTSSESTDDPEYRNFRDELPDRVMEMGADLAPGATNATLTAGADPNTFIVAGTVLMSQDTGEIMRAQGTPDAAGAFVVERDIGGSVNGLIPNGSNLVVIGSSHQEGADTPTPVSFDAQLTTNFTQIFRNAFSVTGTLQQTYLRTGDKLDEKMTKALKLHMSDIERAMFFGVKHEDNTTASMPIRYTGGLISQITQNVIDLTVAPTPADIHTAVNRLTEQEFDRLLIERVFGFGSSQKIAFCGPRTVSLLQQLAKDKWTPDAVSGTYGVSFTRYHTFAGDILVHLHPQFRQIPQMESSMVLIDFPYVRYRYMAARDTALLENRQGNGQDLTLHEYLTECGLELLQDKVHTHIRGWTSV